MMKTFRKTGICFILVLTVACLSLVGCSKSYDYQFSMPKKGETIAVFKTSMGDFTVRFFEKEAPKAVENFVEHAKAGYYDGVTFHRVIEDFMIQGGDPEGTGKGGESIYGEAFEDEIVSYLSPYRGSLCMANRGADNTNTSQFFIVTCTDTDVSREERLNKSDSTPKENRVAQEKLDLYAEKGGAIWLDNEVSTLYNLSTGDRANKHTVFGQVIDGMDVVDAISQVPVYSEEEYIDAQIDDKNQTEVMENKPKEDVIINTIEITEYSPN